MAKKPEVENEEIVVGSNPIEKYQKPLGIAGAVLIVLALGYVGFTRLYLEPQQKEAASQIFKAEQYFAKDSFNVALTGNSDFAGFAEIASSYGLTEVGNMANYYAGICCLHIGNTTKDSIQAVTYFEDALSYLKKFDTDSEIIGPMSLGAAGDASSELGDYEGAAKFYEKAANASTNEYTSPMYLQKAGLAYEELGDNAKAKAVFEAIKEKYPDSQIGKKIDKFIARVSG